MLKRYELVIDRDVDMWYNMIMGMVPLSKGNIMALKMYEWDSTVYDEPSFVEVLDVAREYNVGAVATACSTMFIGEETDLNAFLEIQKVYDRDVTYDVTVKGPLG